MMDKINRALGRQGPEATQDTARRDSEAQVSNVESIDEAREQNQEEVAIEKPRDDGRIKERFDELDDSRTAIEGWIAEWGEFDKMQAEDSGDSVRANPELIAKIRDGKEGAVLNAAQWAENAHQAFAQLGIEQVTPEEEELMNITLDEIDGLVDGAPDELANAIRAKSDSLRGAKIAA